MCIQYSPATNWFQYASFLSQSTIGIDGKIFLQSIYEAKCCAFIAGLSDYRFLYSVLYSVLCFIQKQTDGTRGWCVNLTVVHSSSLSVRQVKRGFSGHLHRLSPGICCSGLIKKYFILWLWWLGGEVVKSLVNQKGKIVWDPCFDVSEEAEPRRLQTTWREGGILPLRKQESGSFKILKILYWLCA